jgi:hypothetical protein
MFLTNLFQEWLFVTDARFLSFGGSPDRQNAVIQLKEVRAYPDWPLLWPD